MQFLRQFAGQTTGYGLHVVKLLTTASHTPWCRPVVTGFMTWIIYALITSGRTTRED